MSYKSFAPEVCVGNLKPIPGIMGTNPGQDASLSQATIAHSPTTGSLEMPFNLQNIFLDWGGNQSQRKNMQIPQTCIVKIGFEPPTLENEEMC